MEYSKIDCLQLIYNRRMRGRSKGRLEYYKKGRIFAVSAIKQKKIISEMIKHDECMYNNEGCGLWNTQGYTFGRI